MGEVIRVAVSGASGRMGQEVARTVRAQADMRLVAAIDVAGAGSDVAQQDGSPCGVIVQSDISKALGETDVMVDFTRGDVAPANILAAVRAGVACVVGTTGIAADAMARIGEAAREKSVPVLVAPNFALGAVLMMRFAQEAARFYEWAEIIEMHHENKIDAPSGTALRTAELMTSDKTFQSIKNETEKLPGARGAQHGGVRIHSVRLPGLVAHQQVMLGGSGETLTLRHDSMSRVSFMPGVMLAIRAIRGRTGLIVGLENLMH